MGVCLLVYVALLVCLLTDLKCNVFIEKTEKMQQCPYFRWEDSDDAATPPNSSDAESYPGSSPPPLLPPTQLPHNTTVAALKETCQEIGCTAPTHTFVRNAIAANVWNIAKLVEAALL